MNLFTPFKISEKTKEGTNSPIKTGISKDKLPLVILRSL